MDTEVPGIAICFDHFRLTREVLLPILHVPVTDLGLKVAGKLDPVRWIDVDHLHLASKILPAGER